MSVDVHRRILGGSCRAPPHRRATLTSEAPLALNTPKAVAGRPLSRAMERTSSTPSRTSAISRRRTNLPAAHDDLRVREILRALRAAQHADRLLAAADLGAPAGGIEIERAQLLVDLDRGEAQACMRAGSSSTRISRSHAAAARDLRDAGNRQQRLVTVLSMNQLSSSGVREVVLTA
jgi:hypothetical protein